MASFKKQRGRGGTDGGVHDNEKPRVLSSKIFFYISQVVKRASCGRHIWWLFALA
jgi:hypothetical protein